jgi:DNA-binding SARP family transcriptional activator
LALLLLEANRVVSRERLIDALWEDEPPETARKALQVYVSQLRKLLGRERLLTRASGYLLSLDGDELDLARFEELRARGELEEALALWRGPPLAELARYQFARDEAARLEELRLACLEARLERDLNAGKAAEVVGELEALVRNQPLRERPRGLLMLALYRSGRQAEALETYQDARRTLVEGLGIEPDQKLRELHQRILNQDPALQPSPVGAAGVGGLEQSGSVFVGRERELGELLGGLDDAFAGRGRLFLLVGEPGIGKSRLAEELVARARGRGVRVLVGRCWEAGGAPAYWPWVQSLRDHVAEAPVEALVGQLGDGAADLAQLLPELRAVLPALPTPPSLEPESARFHLFDSVTRFLKSAAAAQPLLLFLDDVHAADESSLLLLRFLARELADSRLLLIVAYRDVDPTIGEPLAAALGELVREAATRRLQLVGFRESEVDEYISQAAKVTPDSAVVAEIYSQTDGNPLFVGEVTRLLLDEGALTRTIGGPGSRVRIPQGVHDVIGRRLRRLPETSQQALTYASVLGRDFPLELLARLAGSSEPAVLEALDDAIKERIVGEAAAANGYFRFAHVLIRDTLYEDLTPARRLRLHREAGEAIEAIYADRLEPHLGELAHHFAEAAPAGDLEKAMHYARRAGDRAAELLAFEEAARLYRLAISLTDAGDLVGRRQRCELLLGLGDVQARAGDMPAARESFLYAAELGGEIGASELLARAALGYGGRFVFTRATDDHRLVPLLEQAKDALADEQSPLKVRVLTRLANAVSQDAPALSDTLTAEALDLARLLNDPATLAFAISGRLWATRAPTDLDQRWELTNELIEAGDKEIAFEGHALRRMILMARGDIRSIHHEVELMRQLADELGQPSQHWWIASHDAALALLEGRLADAEASIEQARALGDRAQSYDALTYYQLQRFVLRREQGRLAEILPDLEHTAEADPGRPLLRCALALAHHKLGHEEDARKAYQDLATDGFAALQVNNDWLLAAALLAELSAAIADAGHAAALFSRLVEFEQLNIDTYEVGTGAVARYLGLLATTTRQLDQAENHFKHALSLNDQMGAKPWLAHTQHDYANMLLARNDPGDREHARQLREQADAIYRELGMESDVAPTPTVALDA